MAARPRVVVLSRAPIEPPLLDAAAVAAVGADLAAVVARDPAELIAAARDADFVVDAWGRLDAGLIEQLGRCHAIMLQSTGYDYVDVDAATARGIVVINLPFQCIDEVANHAIALLLALNRKLAPGQEHARAGRWDPSSFLPIGPITGETFGLLGFGNIARATGRRAQAFQMRVIAYDPFVDSSVARSGPFAEDPVELLSMDEVLRQSDYLSCHLPLNDKTRHAIGAEQLRSMKPSALLINTARGPIVDEAALIEALRRGRIAGAGLDVLEVEPPDPSNPLLRMNNVIVTPHLAGTSSGTPPRKRAQMQEYLAAYLRGARPAGLVNSAAWDRAQAALRHST